MPEGFTENPSYFSQILKLIDQILLSGVGVILLQVGHIPSWELIGALHGEAEKRKGHRTPFVSLDLATAGRTGPPVGMPLFYRLSQEPRRKEMLSHPTQLQGYWSCYSACEGVLERSSLCRLELNGSPQLVQCGF